MTAIPLTPYSTDSNERDNVLVTLVLISVVISYLIHQLVALLHWDYGWLIDAPTAAGVYVVLRQIFAGKIWRVSWIRSIARLKMPDLGGKWEGTFRSSYDDFQSDRACEMEVKQNWLTISIIFKASNSESVSILAGLATQNAAGPQLAYCYVNRAKYDLNLLDHDGTQCLVLKRDDDGDLLEGEYFTNRKDGQTRGHMVLRRSA